MKQLRWWAVVGAVAAGAVLSACGSGDSSSDTVSLRIANATLTHPSLDLLVGSTVAISATAIDTVSAYNGPASGSLTLQVNDAGGATSLNTVVPTLTGGGHYTLLAYESGGVVKTAVLSEDVAAAGTGVSTLRFYDLAVEAGAIDIYITPNACTTANLSAIAPSLSFATLTSPNALSVTQGAGNFNVCVTGSGNKSDLRMSLPISVVSTQVATVLLTPASGGLLLNGSSLIQQGAYAAVRNTNSRVRLASAVSGTGTVVAASSSDGTVIDSGSVAPAFGFYTLVPASSSLNVSVNGATVAVAAPATLVAGSDTTLLVSGAPGSATAVLIADDNRPPSAASNTKLRLINGISGSTGTLTLTANSAPVGINVPVGAASSYVSAVNTTSSSNTANSFGFSLSSSTAGQLNLTNANVTLAANAAYSILAVGSTAAPQLLIR